MEKIASFEVDHRYIEPGLYLSRVDGDVTTYDLRTRKPNIERSEMMDNETMHSVEHMLATYLRNSRMGDRIIYFGPMGCQTGFYLLVRNSQHEETVEVLKDCLRRSIAHEGEIFGNSEIECGNYKTLSLSKAKKECESYLSCLDGWSTEKLVYNNNK